jgi:uncharacterized protein YbjT (DUF2867 family)
MHVVTGAFSYTGSYVAGELLSSGASVKTLSRAPDPAHPLSPKVAFGLLRFDEAALAAELRGVDTLYNTYWVRFEARGVTWESVLANTRVLLRAARTAGVRRVVHFSVSNASEASPYSYSRAKAAAEREVRNSGLSYAVVRPTLIVGRDDVLLNNIAWALRRLPLFLVPGDGRYRVQPIAVEDLARLGVDLGQGGDDVTCDAAGPDAVPFGQSAHGVASSTRRCRWRCSLRERRVESLATSSSRVTSSERSWTTCSPHANRRPAPQASTTGWPRTAMRSAAHSCRSSNATGTNPRRVARFYEKNVCEIVGLKQGEALFLGTTTRILKPRVRTAKVAEKFPKRAASPVSGNRRTRFHEPAASR